MQGEFGIAGVTFNGRQELLEKLWLEAYESGDRRMVELVPEPENKYDANAVRIDVNMNGIKKDIGYVPKDINQNVLALLKDDRIKYARLIKVGKVPDKNIFGGTISYEISEK